MKKAKANQGSSNLAVLGVIGLTFLLIKSGQPLVLSVLVPVVILSLICFPKKRRRKN